MFKNPFNLNFYFFFIMADKMAFIFKMAAITDLDLFVILNITALADFYAFCV